jgi:5-methylcytosine-specific restriction endonuclease McrA
MYKRQKGLCWICGERMAISPLSAGKGKYASFDHLTPKSDGGGNTQDNLRLAHQKCNSARGSVPVTNVLIALAIGE